MDFATVSSGISAETVAWTPLGWKCQWYSEIDPFCNEVLQFRNPGIPNRGDMLKLKRGKNERSIDLLAGGTPCQGFSVAGKRGGMDDDRSKLSLRFLEILSEFDASWCMWENVPGVLSSNDGRDFGAFLAGLAERGYGYAWRILDAQYFGVPQRRRRVFVIGYRGNDWRPPAAVLFDTKSLSGYTPKSGKTWSDVAYCVGAGSANGCGKEHQNILISGPITNSYDRGDGLDPLVCYENHGQDSRIRKVEYPTINARAGTGGNNLPLIASILRSGGDSGIPSSRGENIICGALSPGAHPDGFNGQDAYTGQLIFQSKASPNNSMNPSDVSKSDGLAIIESSFVRRLTPVECERLQGFPDNYTRIPWRNKPAEKCPDSHRYKALGNSMAIPVVRRIGQRIDTVSRLMVDQKA